MSSALSTTAAGPVFRGFRNADDLHGVLAREIAERLAAAVARRRHGSLVLSGGTTPGALYDLLAGTDLPWNRIAVTLSDERWIDTGSERSNEHLARSRFLTGRAAAAHLVPLKTADDSAAAGQPAVDAAVAAMPRPFDVVLLGMGTDGHIASLIPGAQGLRRAMDCADPALARALEPADLAAMGERMTLTLRAILGTQWIVLLIRGEAKLDAYKRALGGDDVLDAPVRGVLHQTSVPVSVFWSD